MTNSHNVSKVPGTNGNGTTNNNKPNLPSTGEDHSMSPIFHGAGILLMSMGAFYIRRKH
ncbi:LPXTG cell wall anchor domain-containing protein [Vagococcus sp. CY53-2]|uniref:LPXTG cell wall anchor domain-containing protein n=1 Tax=Vagococcus sp. CY53-2 TaxID=2925780 RepID=UPI00240E4716|nr:LPXTG cell wall anchor domain-containing protein [Vagococcus sp. CY53-2]